MAQSLYILMMEDERNLVVETNNIMNPVDEDEIINEAESLGMTGKIEYNVAHFEIGEGESGMDEFIDDDDLSELVDSLCLDAIDGIEEAIHDTYGYNVEHIQEESGSVFIEEEEYED